jgi:hypothetical protein
LYYETNKSILDIYSLSKADPELIKQVFKHQQVPSIPMTDLKKSNSIMIITKKRK